MSSEKQLREGIRTELERVWKGSWGGNHLQGEEAVAPDEEGDDGRIEHDGRELREVVLHGDAAEVLRHERRSGSRIVGGNQMVSQVMKST